MKFFVITVSIAVVVSIFMFFIDNKQEVANAYAVATSTSDYSRDSSNSDGFFDFFWDAISLIFKGFMVGVLIWGAKLYFDNE